MKRVILFGSEGRMGRAVCAIAAEENVEVIAAPTPGERPPLQAADVVVDFSVPAAIDEVCRIAREVGVPLVIGTTGHDQAQLNKIARAGDEIAIVHAANFSIGVNALAFLTEQAARVLGDAFDVEIVEAHHRLKKDAPSGTAKALADVVQRARGSRRLRHGREGMLGERESHEIGMHAIRGGDIVGEHTVIFAGEGERLELIHRSSSRETFARGALRAARWLIGKAPGLYGMRDVIGPVNESASSFSDQKTEIADRHR